MTVQAGGTLAVGAGASVLIGPNASGGSETLSDNGTLTFTNDVVTLNATNYANTTTQIVVGNGGLLSASGTTFNAVVGYGGATQIVADSGGEIQASNSTFSLSQLNFAIGAVVNAGDLVGNAFNLPLYIPAIDVQYLSGAGNNNLSFQTINVQSDTLTSGQSVDLNLIGTSLASNPRYVLPGNFTIDQGASLTVAANVPLQIGPNASGGSETLTDDGTLTFANDVVTLNATNYANTTTQIVVGNGGLLSASGTTFNAVVGHGGATQIVADSGGEIQASNSTFSLSQLNFAIGAVVNAGDLVGNAFNLPLYIPAIDVQYLSGAGNDNLTFQTINIQSDTLTSGQSVSLNVIGTSSATNPRYVLPGNFTIDQGASLTVAANVPVLIGPNASGGSETLTDNGTLTFTNDVVTLNAINYANTTTQIVVGNGGLLSASGTTFNAVVADGGATQIVADSGGEIQASNSTFSLSQLNFAIGAVVNAGDLVGNAFNLPLYIPAIDVPYLSGAGNNNLSFQTINVQSDTLTSGQSVDLNLIGTSLASNPRYVLPGNFTIDQGASLTVAANVPLQIGPNASGGSETLTDDGTLTFANDVVTLNATNYANSTTQIVVGNGGLLSASGTTFNAVVGYGGATQIVADSGGGIQASNSTFSLSQLNFAIGAVVNAGDLVGNAFNLPLYIPAIDVQYLSGAGNDNLSFQTIDIQSDTLTSGQSVSLNVIGTSSATNPRYVLPGNFTIDQGASLTVAANVPVLIGPNASGGSETLTDNGTLTFTNDVVTLNATNYANTTTQIVVGNGGLLSASGTTFNAVVADGGATQIVADSGGEIQASNSTFALSNVSLDVGAVLNAGDLVNNAFDTPLYIPAIDVQYLSGAGNNNLSFQTINIQSDTLTSGQSVDLNLIGTSLASNPRYIFPGNFTINQGATLAVTANVAVQIGPNAAGGSETLADNGTLTFAAGDTVTLNATNYANTTTQIVVGNGGLLTTSGTTFNAVVAYGGTAQIVVDSGGHLQASNSAFALSNVNLNVGSILNAGDLIGNAFDTSLYIQAIDLQYLSGAANNNLSFQAIDIQSDTLTSGQSVTLNAIGTQTTANLSYVLPGNFTIDQGATLTVAASVAVLIGPNASGGSETLADNGTLTFTKDVVTLNASNYANTTTQIVVGSTGVLNISGTTFNPVVAYGGTTQIVVNSGGQFQASTSGGAVTFGSGGAGNTFTSYSAINAGNGSSITIGESLEIDSSAIVTVSANSSLTIDGNLLGNTQNPALFNPQGTVTLNGAGTSTSPELLEAMSADLGSAATSFLNNFAFGTLELNHTYVKLVDQSVNSPGSAAQAVYANSLGCPSRLHAEPQWPEPVRAR